MLLYPTCSSRINLQPFMWPPSPCGLMYFSFSSQVQHVLQRTALSPDINYSFFFLSSLFDLPFYASFIAFLFSSFPLLFFITTIPRMHRSCFSLRLRCVAFRHASVVPNVLLISVLQLFKTYYDQTYFKAILCFWPDCAKKDMIFLACFEGRFSNFKKENPHTSRRTDIQPP